jgi:hypothetical protein
MVELDARCAVSEFIELSIGSMCRIKSLTGGEDTIQLLLGSRRRTRCSPASLVPRSAANRTSAPICSLSNSPW